MRKLECLDFLATFDPRSADFKLQSAYVVGECVLARACLVPRRTGVLHQTGNVISIIAKAAILAAIDLRSTLPWFHLEAPFVLLARLALASLVLEYATSAS